MLDWFELTNVHVEIKDDTKLVHIYLDENELTTEEQTSAPMALHVRACFMISP